MTCVTPGHNAPIHTRSDSDSGRVFDRSSSTAGEVAGHCGLLATSRMTPSARRVAGGRSLEASGLGRVSGIMPRVYVHVRPHERLDLTSHLTGSRRGQSRAAVASTFTIWVANAQAELVAGTTITTVDLEAAASVGSDLGVTQFTADDPPCRATSRRRQAVFRAATGGDGQSFRSWIQILNPLIEPSKRQTGRDPRFGRLKELLAIKHDNLKGPGPHLGPKTV